MRRQRGAAIIMAMLVVAVTATLVAGTYWRQSIVLRQAENELAYAQAKWLLRGAIDWTSLILREDARTSAVDHLGEPWAVPLADTHLNQGDGRDPVYLAGEMRDEQAKFNLRNLAGPKGVDEAELAVLRRLLGLAGASTGAAEPIAERVIAGGLLSVDDLTGIDGEVVERLRPFVTVLPQRTPVNANTAPAEVLAARFDLGLAEARRLVASRARAYFNNRADVLARLPELKLQASDADIAVATQFFMVDGTVSFRRARLHTRALLRREVNRVEPVWVREAA
jgi:general secretion pathway protein K